jgi:DNA invertase Pin-like site-specific DNA recombinase
MTHAAIYARKSNAEGDKDANAKSVAVQRDVCTRFALSKGWTVTAFYADDDVTGAIYERPGLAQLLADAGSDGRAFDIVVVSALDRIGRGKSAETIAVLDAFEKVSVQVWTADDGQEATNVDDETGMREIMRTIKIVGARTERMKTITRVKNAARKRFDAGLVVAGRVYGYTNERLPGVKASAVLKQNDAQAAVVERIFRLTSEGMGLVRVAKLLNAEGVPGPQRLSDAAIERLQREGKVVPTNKWQATGVREVLHRETYIGRLSYGTVVRTGRYKVSPTTGKKVAEKKRVPRDQWVVVERPELRLISDELWEAAHARIKKAKAGFLRTSTGKLLGQVETAKGQALLSGFIICGAPARSPRLHGGDICGEPMIATSRGRKGLPVYACRAVRAGKGKDYCDNSTAVPRAELEEAVIASLRKTFSAESFKEHQRRIAQDQELKASRQAQRANLTVELPKLQAKAARLAKMVGDIDDAGELLAEYKAVQAQVKDVKDQLAYLDRADDQATVHEADAAALEATWSDWLAQADNDPGVARQMLRKALATPIAVRPTGKGTWSFAGFAKLDEVVAGGIGKDRKTSTVLSGLRDSETAEKMMAHLNQALAGTLDGLVPRGVKVRFVLRGEDDAESNGHRPIAGGVDDGVLPVGASDMAPIPPTFGSPRHNRVAPLDRAHSGGRSHSPPGRSGLEPPIPRRA